MHSKKAVCTIAKSAGTTIIEKGAVQSQTETETAHGAAQQEMTDITLAAGAPGSNVLVSDPGPQPRTGLGKTVTSTDALIGRIRVPLAQLRRATYPPPRRHSTRVSRSPRRLIEEL